MLHAGLNPLRHEESLLFGGLQIVEHFPHAAPVPVKTQHVANPAVGLRSINWHRSRAEFHLEKRPEFFLSSGTLWFRAGCRFRTRVCHHFVATLVHGVAGVVNRPGCIPRNPLIMRWCARQDSNLNTLASTRT